MPQTQLRGGQCPQHSLSAPQAGLHPVQHRSLQATKNRLQLISLSFLKSAFTLIPNLPHRDFLSYPNPGSLAPTPKAYEISQTPPACGGADSPRPLQCSHAFPPRLARGGPPTASCASFADPPPPCLPLGKSPVCQRSCLRPRESYFYRCFLEFCLLLVTV